MSQMSYYFSTAHHTINTFMEMRKLIDLLEAKGEGNKITRGAFLYLEPKGEVQFAQCATCYLFMPGRQRCSIFGPDDVVVANASCGLYVNGTPHDDQEIISAVTPHEAGYVEGQVRCENCTWYDADAGTCGLFELLNRADPGAFDCDPQVQAKACCNGWQTAYPHLDVSIQH